MADRFAFVVACDAYEHFANLSYCRGDAAYLADTLVEFCDYPASHVVRHALDLGSMTTPDDVLGELRDLVGRAKPGDTVLFYFAGHGHAIRNEAYLLLPNSTADLQDSAVPIVKVTEALRRDRLTCVRVFDACRSGVYARTPAGPAPDASAFARAITAPQPEGWVTFASCAPDEESYEDPKLSHGVYTWCLCDYIRATAGGTRITPGPLHDAVVCAVAQFNEPSRRSQTPVMHASLVGSVSIAVRKAVAAVQGQPAMCDGRELFSALACARASRGDLVQHRQSELGSAARAAQQLLQAGLPALTELDPQASVVLGDTDLIPAHCLSAVVKHWNSRGLRTMHDLSQDVEESTGLGYLGIYGGAPRRVTYNVRTTTAAPCVAAIMWPGDEFVAGGTLLCYELPMDTQLCVQGWLSVASFISADTSPVMLFEAFGRIDADWPSILRQPIEQAGERCIALLRRSALAKLNYLEKERALGL